MLKRATIIYDIRVNRSKVECHLYQSLQQSNQHNLSTLVSDYAPKIILNYLLSLSFLTIDSDCPLRG